MNTDIFKINDLPDYFKGNLFLALFHTIAVPVYNVGKILLLGEIPARLDHFKHSGLILGAIRFS